MNKKIRWGIISTAKIGQSALIPALLKSKECELVAIASRKKTAAKKVADAFNIPVHYGSYEELFADPNIDAVYNPLPNHLHVPVSLQAAKAGKHVLCEKPSALNSQDAKKLLQIPKGIVFMEAFMVRFHLQWLEIQKMVKAKKLGEVKAIQAFFSYYNTDSKNIRNKAEWGGGGMYDIGCYPTTISKLIFGTAPQRVLAVADLDPKTKVDRLCSAVYEFDKGRHLTFTVSTQLTPCQVVHIVGTKGRIEVVIPFNAIPDKPATIIFNDGSSLDDSTAKKIKIPACDQYKLECEAFNRAVRKEKKLQYSVDDALENVKILDAVFKSIKTAKWQNVSK